MCQENELCQVWKIMEKHLEVSLQPCRYYSAKLYCLVTEAGVHEWPAQGILDSAVCETRTHDLSITNSAFYHNFMLLVQSLGTVSHWTSIPHLHQPPKTCSRHIFFHVPTLLTNCFQSMSCEHCTVLL